jgi:uncharacterized protein YggE
MQVQKPKEDRVLRTAGRATVRVKPDAARVFFGVQTTAATIKEARAENNARVRKIMQALTALKIPDLKMKTSDVRADILYGRADGHQLPPVVGYRVANTFTVLVQDDDPVKLGELASRVLDSALESGANSVQQIAFLSKAGLTKTRRQALKGAVEDALANARALAAGAGKDRVESVAIDGQPVYQDRPWSGNYGMVQAVQVPVPGGGESEAALVVGDLEVTCQVSVTCHY